VKILKIFLNRVFITGILLIIQIAWLLYFILKLTRYSTIISIGFTILSMAMVIYIINNEDNSSYKISWIILIMLAPLFGGLFYFSFGDRKPAKRLRKRLNATHVIMQPYYQQEKNIITELIRKNEREAGICQYILNRGEFPVYKNTTSKYYSVGEEMYQDILLELENAKHFIFLEYFIIAQGTMWNTILEILERKVAQGVDVRLIYDDVGSVFSLPKGYEKTMEAKGIKCLAFNPFIPFFSLVMNNRDHRKIMVIDGHTAFNGGINLADEYINQLKRFGHWKDTGVMIKGNAVWNFTLMFMELWIAFKDVDVDIEKLRPHTYHKDPFDSDGYVLPFSDSPLDSETLGENIYIEIINLAKKYLYIFTPYLIIDDEMKAALCLAAKRGVDIRIVTPGIPDKKIVYRLTRSNYAPLLKAGIKIYEYTPGFIHAKSFVCDDDIAVVGTINMDYRSLYLHFECGTYLYHTTSILNLKKDCVSTMKKSREIKKGDIKEGLFGRLIDATLRLFSPLL